MLSLTTIIALDFGQLFSGALITETMFGYLGMGKLIYDSILGNDYNVPLVGLLLATAVVLAGNFLADLASAALDPRVSFRALEAARWAWRPPSISSQARPGSYGAASAATGLRCRQDR